MRPPGQKWARKPKEKICRIQGATWREGGERRGGISLRVRSDEKDEFPNSPASALC
jgi:hypothetical protein